MKLATRIFVAVFWFFMSVFFFVTFAFHGIKGDLAPLTAFLGMTVLGFGSLYASCYAVADLAKFVYKRAREDFEKVYVSLKELNNTTVETEESLNEAERKGKGKFLKN